MQTIQQFNQYSKNLRDMLILRYEPIAIKMIRSEEEIPADAIDPRKERGEHLAFCQALAMTRRDKKKVYMDKYSHWCWNPLIGLGLVECKEGSESFEVVCRNLGMADLDAARKFFAKFPRLEYGEYIGTVMAPLSCCTFEPDLVLIYANNAQLRSMLWAVKYMTGKIVETQMDAIDSCIYSCVPPMLSREYRVTIPDPGEYERGCADENEIIFSVPGERVEELVKGLEFFRSIKLGYADFSKEMKFNFARPPFYNELYALWELDEGEVWNK